MSPRGLEQFAITVSAGSSRNVDPRDRRHILQSQGLAELEAAEVDLDVLRDRRRQRLDVKLACDLLHDATDLGSRRLADELHGDACLDRLVEPHLVEVDVCDRPTNRMLLVVLEHGVMWCLLTFDHDVDDPVQAGGAGQRDAQLSLADDERLVRLSVEHARDQPLAPQALDVAGAELIGAALLDLECDPVPGHGGEV